MIFSKHSARFLHSLCKAKNQEEAGRGHLFNHAFVSDAACLFRARMEGGGGLGLLLWKYPQRSEGPPCPPRGSLCIQIGRGVGGSGISVAEVLLLSKEGD